MRLNVGMLGAEELLGAIASQVLDDVNEFAAAVIALAGITFRVFIREDAAGGLQNRFRSEVFAGDQFEAAVLALDFVLDGFVNVGIDGGKRAGHSLLSRSLQLSLARGCYDRHDARIVSSFR